MTKIHYFSTNSMSVTVAEANDGKLSYLVRYSNGKTKRVRRNKINNFVGKVCNRIWELTNGEPITYEIKETMLNKWIIKFNNCD